MSDHIKYEGNWWVPEDPKKQIAGILEIDENDGQKLKLHGSFRKEQEIKKNIYKKVIFGNTNKGAISLYNCYLEGSGGNLSGYLYNDFSTYYIFEGEHLNPEEKNITSFNLALPELFAWFGQSLFNPIEIDKGFNNRNIKNIKVNIDDIELNFNFYISESGQYSHPIKLTISEEFSIIGSFKLKRSFEEVREIVHKLTNFFRFAISQNLPQESLSIQLDNSEANHDRKNVRVVYNAKCGLVEDSSTFNILFFYSTNDCFDDILKCWFNKYDLFAPVYDLYFSVFFNQKTIEQAFLNVVYALEAYHRRTKKNFQISKEEHKTRISEIVDSVPPKYGEWLRSKLAFSNEPTLASRLEELICEFKEIDLALIDDPSFISKVVKQRNKLTHYDPKKRGQQVKNSEMFVLLSKLRLLLESCILQQLGIPTDEVTKLVRRKYISKSHFWKRIEK